MANQVITKNGSLNIWTYYFLILNTFVSKRLCVELTECQTVPAFKLLLRLIGRFQMVASKLRVEMSNSATRP